MPVVIDHNMAFDPDFGPADFLDLDIVDELNQMHVTVVDRADAPGIIEFARTYVQ